MLAYKEFTVKGVWKSGKGCFAVDENWDSCVLVDFPNTHALRKGETIGAVVGDPKLWSGHVTYSIDMLVPAFCTKTEAVRYFTDELKLDGVTQAQVKGVYDEYGRFFLQKFFRDSSLISKSSVLNRRAKQSLSFYVQAKDSAMLIETMFPFLQNRKASFYYGEQPDIHHYKGSLSGGIFAKYGGHSIAILRSNPYELAFDSDFRSFTFPIAEKCAVTAGLAKDADARVIALMAKAAMNYIATDWDGSTCFPLPQNDTTNFNAWGNFFVSLSGAESKDYELSGQTFVDHLKDFMDVAQYGIRLVSLHGTWYVTSLYDAEHRFVNKLYEMHEQSSMCFVDDKAFHADIKAIEMSTSVRIGSVYHFHKHQKEAIRAALDNPVSIITGGPGRGKTDVIAAIVELWHKYTGLSSVVTSFTGKATAHAKEGLSSVSHLCLVATMCQLIYGGLKGSCRHCLVIIDEATMVSTSLFEQFLSQCEDCQIAVVGDVDQLPSIDSGQVFRDLIESKHFSVTRLTENQRLAHGGLDKAEAAVINNNFFAMLNGMGDLITWLPNQFEWATNGMAESDAVTAMEQEYLRWIGKSTPDFKKAVMLSPVKSPSDPFSVHRLNKDIQAVVNPWKKGAKSNEKGYSSNIVYGQKPYDVRIRVGDRVMITKNMHDHGVMNGDIGTLLASGDGYRIAMDNGSVVTLPEDAKENIDLAYAMTVHKSQGSDYEHVLIGMSSRMSYGWFAERFMSRNLVYTAATRMKQSVQFFGDKAAFDGAIQRSAASRTTMLPMLLRDAFQ